MKIILVILAILTACQSQASAVAVESSNNACYPYEIIGSKHDSNDADTRFASARREDKKEPVTAFVIGTKFWERKKNNTPYKGVFKVNHILLSAVGVERLTKVYVLQECKQGAE